MPVGTYPPAAPTAAGDLITIHHLLQSPALIRKRMQQLTDIRFVADLILPQRFPTQGGAVQYEEGEGLFTDREVTAVAPGSEYPRANPAGGTPAIAAVSKWGQATRLTDERIKRTRPMGGAVDWALRKVTNTVRKKVDRLAIAAIASKVTNTIEAEGGWEGSAPNMLRDIERAKAELDDLEMGFDADMILMSTNKYALLITDDKIANLRRRETSDNPVYGGEVESIAGLTIAKTPLSNLPGGLDDVWIFDSKQLGGMADEIENDPGYATAENGIQVQTDRIKKADAFDMWARRITVPVVQEPDAGIRITETDAS